MNDAWQSFLESVGAQFSADGNARFATGDHQSARDRTVVCDLSYQALVAVRGADAESFLQGQLSNDIQSLPDDGAQLNAYCNPKGRVYGVLRVSRIDGGFLLQLPAAIAAAVLKRLHMYVLRSKVSIESASDLSSIGVGGLDNGVLGGILGTLPAAPDQISRGDGLSVVRHRDGPRPRYQLIGHPARLAEIWSALVPTATAVNDDVWRWFDIRSGIAEIGPDTSELFIPQMINLDLVNGVSFHKGCYPGQEIVARMRYLGKLKQRMFLCHVASTTVPAAAQIVKSQTKQRVGQTVSVQASPDGGVDLLAVLRLEEARQELALEAGSPLEVLAQPYAVEDTEQRQA